MASDIMGFTGVTHENHSPVSISHLLVFIYVLDTLLFLGEVSYHQSTVYQEDFSEVEGETSDSQYFCEF